MPARSNWTREEVILAMNLYTRLNFGQFDKRNSEIIWLSKHLKRTPDAVVFKLSNLASLDPYHQKRGVSGLAHGSKVDLQVWEEFQADWETMGLISEEMMSHLDKGSTPLWRVDESCLFTESETEREIETKVRAKQQFFRRAVLTSYQNRCCITGNPIPDLLTASHILPWAEYRKDRLNPSNGLCLAKTQDAAFDRYLITLDEDYRVVVSKSIKDHFTVETVRENFQKFEGLKITMPERFLPEPRFLEIHREKFSEI